MTPDLLPQFIIPGLLIALPDWMATPPTALPLGLQMEVLKHGVMNSWALDGTQYAALGSNPVFPMNMNWFDNGNNIKISLTLNQTQDFWLQGIQLKNACGTNRLN
jgi:hypothetical protein